MEIRLIDILIATIAATPGIIATIMQVRKNKSEKNKIDADTSDTLTDTALSLIIPLKEENKRIKLILLKTQRRLTAVEKGVRELTKQVISLGGNPEYICPDPEQMNGEDV